MAGPGCSLWIRQRCTGVNRLLAVCKHCERKHFYTTSSVHRVLVNSRLSSVTPVSRPLRTLYQSAMLFQPRRPRENYKEIEFVHLPPDETFIPFLDEVEQPPEKDLINWKEDTREIGHKKFKNHQFHLKRYQELHLMPCNYRSPRWIDGKAHELDIKRLPIKRKGGEAVYGLLPCLLALKTGQRTPHNLYVIKDYIMEPENRPEIIDEILELAEEKDVPIYAVQYITLQQLSGTRPHEGVSLVASKMPYLKYDMEKPVELYRAAHTEPRIWLVLDHMQDARVFSSILKSAYYLGIDRVFAAVKQELVVNDKNLRSKLTEKEKRTIRTIKKSTGEMIPNCGLSAGVSNLSDGILEILPVYGLRNFVEFLQLHKQHGWQILGVVHGDDYFATATSSKNFSADKDTIVLIGRNGEPVTGKLASLCTAATITGPGAAVEKWADSLNVEVGIGMLLHSLVMSRSSNTESL